MIKKESRQFNISVEGINCEKMYFEHLAKLINNSDSTDNLTEVSTFQYTSSLNSLIYQQVPAVFMLCPIRVLSCFSQSGFPI